MAGIEGTFGQSTLRGADNPLLSEDLDAFTEFVSHFDLYDRRRLVTATKSTWAVPSPSRWGVYAQMKMPSFFDDFYNRIFIFPSSINAGNLLTAQSRSVIVWNAYVTPKTLEAVALGSQPGVTLDYPVGVSVPYDIPALRELEFVVRIEVVGPPTVDSYVEFTVDGGVYNVPITGRRIVVFPFSPNWGSPVDETVTHRSWVLATDDGGEQTGSEGGEVPRRSIEYSINLRTPQQMQRCENLLFAWQGRFFGVPHWGEEARLTADVAAGSVEIPFDTYGLSLEVGAMVSVYLNDEVNEIREIQTITPTGITVTAGFERNWPEGSRIYPCFVGLLSPAMSGAYETSRIGRMPVSFDFEPSSTPGNTEFNVAPFTYRGHELYLGKINWLSAMPFTYTSDAKRVDMGTGKIASYTTAGFSQQSRRHNWTMFDRTDIFEFRKFLGRRQGVSRSAYMPSGVEDFTLAAPITTSDNTITVMPNEYAALIGSHPARRDIIIEMKSGAYFCRRIESSENVAGLIRLQLDDFVGDNIEVNQVRRISFLNLYRLQSPATSIRYLTDSKAICEALLVVKRTED